MSKKLYWALVIIFGAVFFTGLSMLMNQNAEHDLEIWSYYSGGQNKAVEYFNTKSDYDMKFTGIAADNFPTKLDAAISANALPDIIMIDSKDLGRYVSSDNFLDFNAVFERDKNYQKYLSSASEYGLNLGKYEENQMAIKFENSSSVFVYRSDIARDYLDINSPNEMASKTENYEDYTELYRQLKERAREKDKNLSLFATSEYSNYMLNPNNVIKQEVVNSDLTTWLDWLKENIDTGLVYSRFAQRHEVIDDSGETAFLGDIITVNQLREIYDFNQPGLWAVTQTPIDYQGNTAYFLISKDADVEGVKEFFDMTYFNEAWLEENINDLGVLESATVMRNSSLTEVDLEGYFTNPDLRTELSKAAQKTINNNADVTSGYDYGIRNIMTGVMDDYVDGNLKKDDIVSRIETDLKTFYE